MAGADLIGRRVQFKPHMRTELANRVFGVVSSYDSGAELFEVKLELTGETVQVRGDDFFELLGPAAEAAGTTEPEVLTPDQEAGTVETSTEEDIMR